MPKIQMRTHGILPWAVTAALVVLLTPGCFRYLPSQGGGQTEFAGKRQIDPSDVALPEGYVIEAVADGLTFPTDLTFDSAGTPHVLEAGYSYGELWTTPRLLRVGTNGSLESVYTGGRNGPWTGVTWHDGAFYIAEGGQLEGGRILRVTPAGESRVLLEGLPSFGDHHTNAAFVHDGWLYFAQGTATNSGVVGTDNHDFGWLERFARFHDVPCRDVELSGANFTTPDPLTPTASDSATTGAFVPFGTSTEQGQVIPGRIPCSGAVMRMRPDGSDLQLVAWGLRNPFALGRAPDGSLYVLENSYDVRGSRPVFGAGDVFWRLEQGAWYGWPDYHQGLPIYELEHYNAPNEPAPPRLLSTHPGTPPEPAAVFGVHASANHFDFSRSDAFGYRNEAFVAQLGDMAPDVGKVLGPVGFKVSRVNVETGVIHEFAVNRGSSNGPASKLGTGGLERPIAARFSPDGSALYVLDFGVMTMGPEGPQPRTGTGVLWRITRSGGTR